MAIKINFDRNHNALYPTLILTYRTGRKIGKIPARDIVFSSHNWYTEFSFSVDKADCTDSFWKNLKTFKLAYCKEYDMFYELYVEVSEENNLIKNVTSKSLGEAELSQINLYGVEINTEKDILRKDYIPTVVYNSEDSNSSLLHRILDKVPSYSIAEVDDSIKNIQRTFSFDGKNIYDSMQEIAKEINCIFLIRCSLGTDGKIVRCISVKDLESCCLACGNRGEFLGKCDKCQSTNITTGYGEDTSIFVSTDNLADSITLTTDVDSVKNCFKLTAGDDLMTATVANCTANGSGYLWFLPAETREDMSGDLKTKLDEYDADYNYYQNEYSVTPNTTNYNSLITKYASYNSSLKSMPSSIVGYPNIMKRYYDIIDFSLFLQSKLMPAITTTAVTAASELAKMSSLSPVSVENLDSCSEETATNTILSYARSILSSGYKIQVEDVAYEENTWTGTFTVTSYSNEEDNATAESPTTIVINSNYENFIKQKIKRIIGKKSDNAGSILNLFDKNNDDFKSELKKYCMNGLKSFKESCQTCLDVLIAQNAGDDSLWDGSTPNIYDTLYTPYKTKMGYIDDEIKVRNSELETILSMQQFFDAIRGTIRNELNFQAYLGEDLWENLLTYRREDTYSNNNYISEGLDNAQLFNNALEFIEVAKKDIYKSATLQHSITANLKDLLVIPEFSGLVDKFAVGNWIRIMIDRIVYRLRLVGYTIDYSNLQNLSVVFSDVKNMKDGCTDIESVLKQATSMATSYDNVARQASKGAKTENKIEQWKQRGIPLEEVKVVGDKEKQEFVIDNHGILGKEYLPETDTFSEEQVKFINNGIYFTNDAWDTVKTGIGKFTHYNPITKQQETGYGIIADKIVGNIVLSNELGIYNTSGSLHMGDKGLELTVKENADSDNSDETQNAFIIKRETTNNEGQTITEKVFYVDNDGNVNTSGNLYNVGYDDIGGVTQACNIIKGGAEVWTANKKMGYYSTSVYRDEDDILHRGMSINMYPDAEYFTIGVLSQSDDGEVIFPQFEFNKESGTFDFCGNDVISKNIYEISYNPSTDYQTTFFSSAEAQAKDMNGMGFAQFDGECKEGYTVPNSDGSSSTNWIVGHLPRPEKDFSFLGWLYPSGTPVRLKVYDNGYWGVVGVHYQAWSPATGQRLMFTLNYATKR